MIIKMIFISNKLIDESLNSTWIQNSYISNGLKPLSMLCVKITTLPSVKNRNQVNLHIETIKWYIIYDHKEQIQINTNTDASWLYTRVLIKTQHHRRKVQLSYNEVENKLGWN